MASSYGQGGVELIATGEKSGSWGDVTNINLQILARMASGVITVDLTGSGATYTLETDTGGATAALSEGQGKVLVFTSADEACTVTISPNSEQRLYAAINTSGYSVTLTQGSGGDVTVLNNKNAFVYCDGAGSGAAVTDITSALTSLGTMSTQDASSVNITGGAIAGITDLAVADGGTGASDAATALINLGLTSTAAEINTLDGYTGDVDDFNTVPVTTLGTSEASKVVTADANGDVNLSQELKAKSYNETFLTANSTSNTTTLDLEAANVFSTTLTEATTLVFSNPPSTGTAYSFTLKIVQDASASGYAVTFPAAVDWPAGLAPILSTAASAVDMLVFMTHDGGTTWYGFFAGKGMA